MIRLKFYNYGNMQLDVEKELGIEIDVDDFLLESIQFLEFEATDNEADLEDNYIYWFSGKQELKSVSDIKKLLSSKMENTSMKFDIKIIDYNFI